MPRPSLDKRNRQLCNLYRAGPPKTVQQVADKFNISRQRAHMILAENGVAMRNPHYDWKLDPDKRIARARKLYRSGVPAMQLRTLIGWHIGEYYAPSPADRKAHRTALFWKLVEKRGENECWPWLGLYHSHAGEYPLFSFEGETYMSQALFLITRKRKPRYKIVRKCPRRDCANPRHIEDGRSYNYRSKNR